MNTQPSLIQSQEIECSICLEVIDNASRKITPCNHAFHHACLAQVRNNRCPLCRGVLAPIAPRRVPREFFQNLGYHIQSVSVVPQRPPTATDRFLAQVGLEADLGAPNNENINWGNLSHNLNYIS